MKNKYIRFFVQDESRWQEIEIPPWLAEAYRGTILINGQPLIEEGTKIGIFSEVFDKGGIVKIGRDCDIASFVAINCSDSHARCIGLASEPDFRPIVIENNVFIGTHSAVLGGARIGHHSVVAAFTCVCDKEAIPPYSLVYGSPMVVRPGYYRDRIEALQFPTSGTNDPVFP